MKILITGGAGFIGSHVADAYVAAGHKVWVLDNLSLGKKEFVPKDAMLLPWDIADERVGPFLKKEGIELINHHAAHIDLRESVADPAGDAQTNLVGTLRLAEAAREAGVARILFSSTGGALYGEQTQFPAPESHPICPDAPYGLSKWAAEQYLGYYRRTYGMQVQILRYANVYGPRQNPHGEAGVVAIFTARMLKGETPVVHGTGKQSRDFVCVEDLVAANLAALKDRESRTFNVGTGKETTVLEVYNHLRAATNYPKEAVHDAAKEGEQMRSCIDPTAIAEAWGWKPGVTLEDGLRKTVEWFRTKGR